MVVGALFAYYAPSNRGFVRIKESDNVPLDSFPIHDDPLNSLDNNAKQQQQQRTAGRRRKPLRAMAVLTSVAADFDLVSDFFFLRHSLREDRQYREDYAANPVEGEPPYLIPSHLLLMLFLSCIFGTIMYLIIATEGRIVSPITTRLGVDKLSMGAMLFISILVEDIPQVILTFLIEDYYEEGGLLDEVAVFNVMASLYDTCIKLAESFDQRNDIVETGVWCKKSITAHQATITDVLIIPDGVEIGPSRPKRRRSTSDNLVRTAGSRSLLSLGRRGSTSQALIGPVSAGDGLDRSLSSLPARRASQSQLFVEAFFPEEEAIGPRIHFLTTSMDRTAKLWNVASLSDGSASSSQPEQQCISTFKDIEGDGFTCLAWIGPRNPEVKSRVSYFLAGCNNGKVGLFDLSGLCHRSYRWDEEDSKNRASSIAAATINGRNTFICGHESGVIRLWQTWVGNCIGSITGHTKRVTSIAFLGDGKTFVSASIDTTLKLWDSSLDFQSKKELSPDIEVQVAPPKGEEPAYRSHGNPVPLKHLVLQGDEKDAKKRFLGHSGAVLSAACVDANHILSGSQDGTARLWSADSGLCLRVFRGHKGGVYSVLAIDRVTFLTGSRDTTVKAWDALSGECLRTYEGHKSAVTALSIGDVSKDAKESATTFISASADKSVKCWVLTAVSYRDPAETLDHILDIHENTCQCFVGDPGCSSQQPVDLMRACSPEHCEFDHPYHYEAFQPLKT